MVHIYARRITYAQVGYLSTVIKSANLCISLATFYILTRYNRAFITKGAAEMKNTLLVVLILALVLFADTISLTLTRWILG